MAGGTSLRDLMNDVERGLASLQELQKRYDEVGWRIESPRHAKLRHVGYHLIESCATLGMVAEKVEHAELSENKTAAVLDAMTSALVRERADSIARLLFHAAQVANLADVSLGSALRQVYVGSAARFAPNSSFAVLDSRDA